MRRGSTAWALVPAALLLGAGAQAADVGGWYADQQKAAMAAAQKADPDSCPMVLKRAAAEATGRGAYQAALCYLQAEPPDTVAAKAWLMRSAELNYLSADRLLRALQAAEAAHHSATPHCHNLGNGQQLCHGGVPVSAVGGN
jgi:hypothetical protein